MSYLKRGGYRSYLGFFVTCFLAISTVMLSASGEYAASAGDPIESEYETLGVSATYINGKNSLVITSPTAASPDEYLFDLILALDTLQSYNWSHGEDDIAPDELLYLANQVSDSSDGVPLYQYRYLMDRDSIEAYLESASVATYAQDLSKRVKAMARTGGLMYWDTVEDFPLNTLSEGIMLKTDYFLDPSLQKEFARHILPRAEVMDNRVRVPNAILDRIVYRSDTRMLLSYSDHPVDVHKIDGYPCPEGIPKDVIDSDVFFRSYFEGIQQRDRVASMIAPDVVEEIRSQGISIEKIAESAAYKYWLKHFAADMEGATGVLIEEGEEYWTRIVYDPAYWMAVIEENAAGNRRAYEYNPFLELCYRAGGASPVEPPGVPREVQ